MIKLKQGDNVALIAPASGQKHQQSHLIEQAITCLTDWGLVVTITPPLAAHHRYLAASDKVRAESLINALTAPNIKAIFSTRGGYGCARLLPYLTQIPLAIPSPRLLLGFSDMTTLHLHFTRQMCHHLCCVHAPNLATEQFLADTQSAAANRTALRYLLFDGYDTDFNCRVTLNTALNSAMSSSVDPAASHIVSSQTDAVPIDAFHWQEQPKTGGCLSLLVTSLGTEHEITTTDKWLFIEEVGEAPYKVDRMLTHLYNAGKFAAIRGIVFGEMAQCDSPSIKIQDVIKEFAERLSCPVISSPCFGHGKVNLPWFYG